jgi:hypothetical protein
VQALGETLDVQLVEHAVLERCAQRGVVAPVERAFDDDRARHVTRAVERARRVAVGVAQERVVPLQLAVDRARVRVEQ